MAPRNPFEDITPVTAILDTDLIEIRRIGDDPTNAFRKVSAAQLKAYAGGSVALPASVGLAVTQPAANQIFQRLTVSNGLFSKGQGKIPLSVSLTLPALSLDYRLRDAVASGNPVLQDWAPGAYAVPAGTSTVTLGTVPARAGWYYLDIRPNGDNSQIVLGTHPVGMGEIVVGYGQSLMTDMISPINVASATLASLGVTPNPNTAVLGSFANATLQNYPPSWGVPADGTVYNSAGSTTMLGLLSTQLGVNVGFVAHGHNGQQISVFAPGTADYNELISNITAAGGVFGTFLYVQGNTDAYYNTAGSTYQAALGTLIGAIAAAFPAMPFNRVIQSIAADYDTADGTYAAMMVIRAASMAYVASDPLATYVDGLDLALDGSTSPAYVHPTQAGMITEGQEYYRSIMAIRGFVTPHYGPKITGATRVAGSATIKLIIAQDGGTAMTAVGTIANQFTVYNAGTLTTPLTISSASIISATEIDIVLSAAPADSQALDVWYRRLPDSASIISSGIYDNNTADGLSNGRQLRLSPYATTAAAPVPAAVPTIPTLSVTLLRQYDAHTGAYSDTAKTTPATSAGSLVAALADQSGNGADLTQATTAKQGALVLNSANGLPGIQVSGGQCLLRTGDSATPALQTGGASIAFVVRIGSLPVGGSTYYSFGGIENSGNTTTSNDSFNINYGSSGQLFATHGNSGGAATTANDTANPASANELIKVFATYNATTNQTTVSVNTGSVVTGTAQTVYTTGAAWDEIIFGALSGTTFPFNGILYEMDIWNGVASSADHASWHSYATSKWGS